MLTITLFIIAKGNNKNRDWLNQLRCINTIGYDTHSRWWCRPKYTDMEGGPQYSVKWMKGDWKQHTCSSSFYPAFLFTYLPTRSRHVCVYIPMKSNWKDIYPQILHWLSKWDWKILTFFFIHFCIVWICVCVCVCTDYSLNRKKPIKLYSFKNTTQIPSNKHRSFILYCLVLQGQ